MAVPAVLGKVLLSAAKFVVKGFAVQGTGMLVEKAFRGDFTPKRFKTESNPKDKSNVTLAAVRTRSTVSSDRYKASKAISTDICRTDDGTLDVDESRDFMADLDLESRFPIEAANDVGELKSLLNRFEDNPAFRFVFEAMDGRDISSTQQLEVRAYKNGDLHEVVQLDSTNLDGVRFHE